MELIWAKFEANALTGDCIISEHNLEGYLSCMGSDQRIADIHYPTRTGKLIGTTKKHKIKDLVFTCCGTAGREVNKIRNSAAANVSSRQPVPLCRL